MQRSLVVNTAGGRAHFNEHFNCATEARPRAPLDVAPVSLAATLVKLVGLFVAEFNAQGQGSPERGGRFAAR